MSNYQDIYSELPSRVHRAWQRVKTHPDNKAEDLSVTAMLMAAAAGLAMPFENLKDLGAAAKKGWDDHPAFQGVDQKEFKEVLKKCDQFLKQPMDQCEGLKNALLLWCQDLRDIRNAAETERAKAMLNLEEHDTRFALKILRNALAHNNIVAFGGSPNQIERLVFFSEKRVGHGDMSSLDGWHAMSVPVEAFNQFLDAWFALLAQPGAYRGAVAALASE